MHIEVAAPADLPAKVKGDLLEKLVEEFLKTQSFEVTTQLRKTATELDLLGKHRVSRKAIYVECKAYRETLSAVVLRTLLGTIEFHRYQEGWIICTGPLGKDAKGFQDEWEARPTEESHKLSIYTPERITEALINSRVIKSFPNETAVEVLDDEDAVGEWTLLITEYGTFWVISCLVGGIPTGVLAFSAKTAKLVTNRDLLVNLSKTDTSLGSLDFEYVFHLIRQDIEYDSGSSSRKVVEVQYGESWSDYRPARPEHFVGRREAQNHIIRFIESVRHQTTGNRVFAVTGDSGMGKSSLITKLKSRSNGTRYKGHFFVYAVDVRAGTDSSYILWSVLSCLREAAKSGFGNNKADNFRISSPSDPLGSQSIQDFLQSLENNNQVVCLIFDQFEELYSKSDLFSMFEAAQRLMISVISNRSNLVLGFAWKSDSTVQQDHPAYSMWQRFSDHRMEITLSTFTHSEASEAITLFEKELGEKLRPELRRQLIENSQGYPWLLKKLCIHIYEQVRSGSSQPEIIDRTLDVKSLFDRDLQKLTSAERTCLDAIAESAPIDWYEVLNTFGRDVVNGLQDKRLVVRSGDRLNLYWDIFRVYVLTKDVPSIPLTYLPSSPSLRTTLFVTQLLGVSESRTYEEIGRIARISEKSVGNVIRDLVMFGVANSSQFQVNLDKSMPNADMEQVLRRLRQSLRRHALTITLSKKVSEKALGVSDIIDCLKEVNPAAQHKDRTWKIYTERLVQLLLVTGYLIETPDGLLFKDHGNINVAALLRQFRGKGQRGLMFIGEASPIKAIETYDWLKRNQPKTWAKIRTSGYRNAIQSLSHLGLIRVVEGGYYVVHSDDQSISTKELVWKAARNNEVVVQVMGFIRNHPNSEGQEVGHFINQVYEKEWQSSSEQRVGNGLRQWGWWILNGLDRQVVPEPPGSTKIDDDSAVQLLMW
jgi:hypothetical protein